MSAEPPDAQVSTAFLGGRLPVVIAACGHRDAVDEPVAAGGPRPSQALTNVLSGYLTRHPSTPLLVLSGLAEGADTWIAEAALALAATPLGTGADGRPRIALVAALAMPLEAAAADFDDPKHVDRVRHLLSRAVRVIETPTPPDVNIDALRSDNAARARQYA